MYNNVRIKWKPVAVFGGGVLSGNLRTCLLNTGSLMANLKNFSLEQIHLDLQTQSYKKPHHDEAKKLGLRSGEFVLLREVFLKCNIVPWIYARTAIPIGTLQNIPRLANLGDTPLGNYLFSNKFTYRGPIQIGTLKITHSPYKLIANICSNKDSVLWGRRSVFYIKNRSLLITEIFLPKAMLPLDPMKKC